MLTPAQLAITRLLALGGELAPPAPGAARRKFDLAHMRTLLKALGNPQLRFPAVLIAGTNGKGSTAATLASILQLAGYRTGLYTSPHLERPNERVRIDGIAISDEALAAHFFHVEATAKRLVTEAQLPYMPSFFEAITAIAFLHFSGSGPRLAASGPATMPLHSSAEVPFALAPALPATMQAVDVHLGIPVEIAILEVGMGGRLDATNVVEPLLSILTDISLDHIGWLGNTLQQITREKAGILRLYGTLVTLPQHPEANQTIGELAVPLEVQAINAADYLPSRNRELQPATSFPDTLRNRYALSLPSEVFGETVLQIDSPLAGTHQQRNIALALAAAVELHQHHGFILTPEALEQGVRDTKWPGRLQLLLASASGLPHAPILLDAAHNPAGAWALRATLSSLPVTGPRTLVFGCMADKAILELAQILFPIFDEVLLTRSENSRAASLEELAAAAERTGTLYRTLQSPAAALAAAQASTPVNGLIVLAGSIALLGEFVGLLGSHVDG